jgi:glycerate-2-kinase
MLLRVNIHGNGREGANDSHFINFRHKATGQNRLASLKPMTAGNEGTPEEIGSVDPVESIMMQQCKNGHFPKMIIIIIIINMFLSSTKSMPSAPASN